MIHSIAGFWSLKQNRQKPRRKTFHFTRTRNIHEPHDTHTQKVSSKRMLFNMRHCLARTLPFTLHTCRRAFSPPPPLFAVCVLFIELCSCGRAHKCRSCTQRSFRSRLSFAAARFLAGVHSARTLFAAYEYAIDDENAAAPLFDGQSQRDCHLFGCSEVNCTQAVRKSCCFSFTRASPISTQSVADARTLFACVLCALQCKRPRKPIKAADDTRTHTHAGAILPKSIRLMGLCARN